MKKIIILVFIITSFSSLANSINKTKETLKDKQSTTDKKRNLLIPQIGYEKITTKSCSPACEITNDDYIEGTNIGLGFNYQISNIFRMATTPSIFISSDEETRTTVYKTTTSKVTDIIFKITQSLSMNFDSTIGKISPFIAIELGRYNSTTIVENVASKSGPYEKHTHTKALVLGAGAGVSILINSKFYVFGKYTFNRFSNFKDSDRPYANDNFSINTETILTGIGWAF